MTATPPAGIQDAARHLAEERAGAAVAVLERLVAEFPAYVTAQVLLAKSYEADGRPAEALEAWHRAYFLMPGSPLVLRERARLLRAEPVPPSALDIPRPAPEPSEPEEEASEPEEEASEPEEEASEPEEEASEPEEEPAAGRPLMKESLMEEVDDLDGLIERLGNAPRLRPDADFDEAGLEEDEADEEELVSETLARIYASQGEHEAAARAYEQLAARHPERAADLRAKAAELRGLTEGPKAGK